MVKILNNLSQFIWSLNVCWLYILYYTKDENSLSDI